MPGRCGGAGCVGKGCGDGEDEKFDGQRQRDEQDGYAGEIPDEGHRGACQLRTIMENGGSE